MVRVKMNAKHEYEFIANFKVMQNIFKAKRIDKVSALNFTLGCILTLFASCSLYQLKGS